MKIKDPIHGYIELTDEEEDLLDKPSLQRLRNIKQLGLSNLVYPSANHTRFEHTLGVIKLANDYADALNIGNTRRKELRLAALFHDTGHGPWSHLTEQIVDFNHEDMSCEHVDMLEDEINADTDRIKKIIKGELEIGRVIHGDVDADRLDYLQRDAYKTGVEHGMIDGQTIIQNCEINSRRLVYDYKAIQSLESLLVARSHMLRSVYQHHAAAIADAMIVEAADHMPIKFNPKWDDTIADQMMGEYGGQLYQRVRSRNLYKRAGTTEVSPDKARNEILEETGLEESQVLTDRLSLEGDAENPKRENDLDVKVKYYGEIKSLSDISAIPEAVDNPIKYDSMTRVYAPKEKVETVKKVVNNM